MAINDKLTEIHGQIFKHKKGNVWEAYPKDYIRNKITLKHPVQLLIPFKEYSNPYSDVRPDRDYHIINDFFLYSGLR